MIVTDEKTKEMSSAEWTVMKKAKEEGLDPFVGEVLTAAADLQKKVNLLMARGDHSAQFIDKYINDGVAKIIESYSDKVSAAVRSAVARIEKAEEKWINREESDTLKELLRLKRLQVKYSSATVEELNADGTKYVQASAAGVTERDVDELNILSREIRDRDPKNTLLYQSMRAAMVTNNALEPWKNEEAVQEARKLIEFYRDLVPGVLKVRVGPENVHFMKFTISDMIEVKRPVN